MTHRRFEGALRERPARPVHVKFATEECVPLQQATLADEKKLNFKLRLTESITSSSLTNFSETNSSYWGIFSEF